MLSQSMSNPSISNIKSSPFTNRFLYFPISRPSVKTKNSSNSSSSSISSSSNSSSHSHSNINNNNACSKNKNLGGNAPTSFSKGTLIELSSGELKRVEDMRTEDFITSSSKNPNLQLIDTTVVKMMSQSKNVVQITLSYNNNKVNIEFINRIEAIC